MSAPKAEVTTREDAERQQQLGAQHPARANRAVADTVMKMTANMLVATAWRGDIPTMIMSGTLMSELPPVIAPSAPVATMRAAEDGDLSAGHLGPLIARLARR